MYKIAAFFPQSRRNPLVLPSRSRKRAHTKAKIMVRRACLGCGQLIATGSRCGPCARAYRSSYSRHGWAVSVKRRDGWRCVMCGSRDRVEADHIVPKSQHGPDTLENGRTLCHDCHTKRARGEEPQPVPHDRTPRTLAQLIADEAANAPIEEMVADVPPIEAIIDEARRGW